MAGIESTIELLERIMADDIPKSSADKIHMVYRNEDTGTVVYEVPMYWNRREHIGYYVANANGYSKSYGRRLNSGSLPNFKVDEIIEDEEKIVIPRDMEGIITNGWYLGLDVVFRKDEFARLDRKWSKGSGRNTNLPATRKLQTREYQYMLGGMFIKLGINKPHKFIVSETARTFISLYTAPTEEIQNHKGIASFFGVSNVVGGGSFSVNKENMLVLGDSSSDYSSIPRVAAQGCAELLRPELEKAGMKIDGMIINPHEGANEFWLNDYWSRERWKQH